LLYAALDLPVERHAAWLDSLAPEHAHLRAGLEQVLRSAARASSRFGSALADAGNSRYMKVDVRGSSARVIRTILELPFRVVFRLACRIDSAKSLLNRRPDQGVRHPPFFQDLSILPGSWELARLQNAPALIRGERRGIAVLGQASSRADDCGRVNPRRLRRPCSAAGRMVWGCLGDPFSREVPIEATRPVHLDRRTAD
jgi:hypothetical protein